MVILWWRLRPLPTPAGEWTHKRGVPDDTAGARRGVAQDTRVIFVSATSVARSLAPGFLGGLQRVFVCDTCGMRCEPHKHGFPGAPNELVHCKMRHFDDNSQPQQRMAGQWRQWQKSAGRGPVHYPSEASSGCMGQPIRPQQRLRSLRPTRGSPLRGALCGARLVPPGLLGPELAADHCTPSESTLTPASHCGSEPRDP